MFNILPKKSKGFTLIELMVAIAIVAILATVGLTVFSNTQKSARDAKRRTDIDSIAKALENNRSNTKNYTTYTWITGAGFAGSTVPADPKSTQTYCADIDSTVPIGAKPDIGSWDGTSCPTGWGAPSTDLTPQIGDITAWTVCARLENPAQTYCKFSQQ